MTAAPRGPIQAVSGFFGASLELSSILTFETGISADARNNSISKGDKMDARLLSAGLLAMISGCLSGCLAPAGFPRELGQVVEKMTEMVAEQGVLDNFTSQIEGDIFNPGLESYMIIGAGVRLRGVQGSVDVGTEGTGTQLPAGALEQMWSTLQDPNVPQAAKDKIWEAINWNRDESPHNPVPSPP